MPNLPFHSGIFEQSFSGKPNLLLLSVNKVSYSLPLNAAGRRLSYTQLLVSHQHSNVKNGLNIREQVNVAYLTSEIIFIRGKRNLLIWQADIFLSSWGKEKKSRTWKRQSVGDNPHSQWIIRNSWFAQFQDFLKLNSQNPNPNYTVRECVPASTLANREYKSWLTWKSEIIRGPDGDVHATVWCRGASPESVQSPASPSAYCKDGPLKGNRNFLPVVQDSRILYFSTTQLKTNSFFFSSNSYIYLSILRNIHS